MPVGMVEELLSNGSLSLEWNLNGIMGSGMDAYVTGIDAATEHGTGTNIMHDPLWQLHAPTQALKCSIM